MTGLVLEISHGKRESQRKLGLDKATRDALADYCRRRWQAGTAKAAAREWDLSTDEGRGVVAGRASQTTIDKIIKHPRGGWAVLLPVLGEVIGHGVDAFIHEQRKAHADHAERLGALVGGRRPMAADRSFDHPDIDRVTDHGRRRLTDRAAEGRR